MVSQTPPVRLHPIALRCVFDAIFPPSRFLDPSLGNHSVSPWCQAMRTRKALTLVCREWRAVALPFLYGELILRRVGQLPALAATIRSNPELFGPLIYSLSFSFHFPYGYRHMVENCIAFVLRKCLNLRTLAFTSAFIDVPGDSNRAIRVPFGFPEYDSDSDPDETAVLDAFREISPRITTFEYYSSDRGGGKGVPVCLIAFTFPNLVRLTLLLTSRTGTRIQAVLRLENLEDLRIWHTDDERLFCGCGSILMTMEFPKLKSLSLHWLLDEEEIKSILEFVKANGRNVEFLDLSRHLYCYGESNAVLSTSSLHSLTLIKALPSLSHIVLEAGYFDDTMLEYLASAPGPVHVDIWSTFGGVPYAKEMSRVRLLDNSLERCVDLPRLLPPVKPNQVDKMLPCVHRIFGFSILETETMITMCPNNVGAHEGDWEGLKDLLFNKWKWEPMENGGSDDPDDSTFDSDFSSPSSINSSYFTENEEANTLDGGEVNALEGEESGEHIGHVIATTEEESLQIFRGIVSHGEDVDSGDEADSEGESDGHNSSVIDVSMST